MAGSINEFKASFQKDVARTNKFQVSIPVPLTLIPYVKNAKNLIYRCENATLPGRTMMTLDQKIGSNPIEKYPYQTTFQDIDLTFIVDDDMNQKVFFDAWLNFINPTYNYNFRYKGDYSTAITISQYDVTNKVSYSINLYDAYPISMNQLDLDWAGDGYHKLTVSFAYTYWTNNSLQSYGMQLVDAGLGYFADAVGGLGGNAIGGLGQSGNLLPNAISGAGQITPYKDPDQPVYGPGDIPGDSNNSIWEQD
jgi:hypothetical protein